MGGKEGVNLYISPVFKAVECVINKIHLTSNAQLAFIFVVCDAGANNALVGRRDVDRVECGRRNEHRILSRRFDDHQRPHFYTGPERPQSAYRRQRSTIWRPVRQRSRRVRSWNTVYDGIFIYSE